MSTCTLPYGALAVALLFLVWAYLSWPVTQPGAVHIAMLPEYGRGPAGLRPPPPALGDLLHVLGTLVQAFGEGVQPSALRFSGTERLPPERVEATLEALALAGWAERRGHGQWRLARDPYTS